MKGECKGEMTAESGRRSNLIMDGAAMTHPK